MCYAIFPASLGCVDIQDFCAEEKRETPLGDVLITGETYARFRGHFN
jgi:hypothetical protein